VPPGSARLAGVARSADGDAYRAGRLAAAEAASVVGRERAASLILLASGAHAGAAVAVASGAAELLPRANIVVASGSGIIVPEGETEGVSAVAALALTVPMTIAASHAAADARSVGIALGRTLEAPRARPVLLFVDPRVFHRDLLAAVHESSGGHMIVGGGTASRGTLAVAEAGQAPRAARAVAARLDGGVKMVVGTSAAVRVLTPYMRVTHMERGFVTHVDDRPALESLTDAVRGRNDRPLVFAAIAPAATGAVDRPMQCLVRSISGVDPARSAVHLGEEVTEGSQIAFAILDPTSARDGVEAMLRDLTRQLAGGVPVAGVYVDCAGRGRGLYGAPDVDVRSIRTRFPELPFAGLFSSFEIAPFDDVPRVHLYTGVLAILYAPS